MKICIIGGRLQGTEACYLARACGMKSILIDIDPSVPAGGLADDFVSGDLVKEEPEVIRAFKEADIILPANENDEPATEDAPDDALVGFHEPAAPAEGEATRLGVSAPARVPGLGKLLAAPVP